MGRAGRTTGRAGRTGGGAGDGGPCPDAQRQPSIKGSRLWLQFDKLKFPREIPICYCETKAAPRNI
jgi:hypothetical protein